MTKKRIKKSKTTHLELTLATLRRLTGAPGAGPACGDKSLPCHAGSCHPPPPTHHCEKHEDEAAITIVPSHQPKPEPEPKPKP